MRAPRRFPLFVLFAAALVVLAVLPAMAGGPLNLNPNDPENMERWPNGGAGIPFQTDQGDLGPFDNASATAEVVAAFDRWESIPTATQTYSNNGQLAFDVDVTNFNPFIQNLFFGTNTSDGLSPIVYDADGSIFIALFGVSGVLGFASPDTRDANGTPIEAVSFLNGGSMPPIGTFPVSAFLGVIFHEFGHYSGLAHTVVNGQNILLGDQTGPTPLNTYGNAPLGETETMYPFAIVGGGEETPHADDIGMISQLYPDPSLATVNGTITGTIFASNGFTPLTGVNVIARNVNDPFVTAASAISGDRGTPGVYTISLPPGTYTIHTDQILAGGFSTTPIALPGPEEFYNGANESGDPTIDDPSESVGVAVVAGGTQSGIDIIFNGTAPGEIDLGDDDFEELALPFEFTICGQSFTSVFVNSNGSLTFGQGDTDFTESTAEFLGGPPRAAALWDDLSPNNGGTVSFTQSQNTFTVRFEDVPEFFSTGANTFEITLTRASDHVEFSYENISALDGLTGVTCGCFAASGLEQETDVRTQPNLTANNMNNQTAVFELFSNLDNDLANFNLKFVNIDKPFADDFEPNDSISDATEIDPPFNSGDVFTAITPIGGDVDYFKVTAEAGQTLVAEVLTGCLDSVLGIFDAAGNLLASDDDSGAGLLSRIVFEVPADGMFFIAVSAFPDFDFDGDGASGGRYTLDVILIDGILLDLGDDDFEEVDLGFTFPFQGVDYTSAFVGSNGYVTFGSGDTDFSESVAEFLNDQPRIAGLWDDLSPNNAGLVLLTRDAGSATVSFIGVPEFVVTGSNTFSITMNADGSVVLDYVSVSAGDGIVGVTQGGGAADPGETDLSAAGGLSVNGTTYEQFTGDFDLNGVTLTFNP